MLALRKLDLLPGVALEDAPLPMPSSGEVLIAVAAAGICGSDLHVACSAPSYAFIAPALPVTLGHEFAGTIVALADGAGGVSIGDRVVVMPSVICGACDRCRRGDADACLRRKGLGMTKNGAFASHVTAPAINCVPLPDELSFDLAALTEPLTVSAEAVSRGEIGRGTRVLVMGPGTIGQGAALLSRRAGAAQVAIAGFNDTHRLSVMRALGFDTVCDMAGTEAAEQLRMLAGDGFDVVIEATGSADAVRDGLKLLRAGGTLVVSGIHDGPVEIDATDMVRRNLQLRGSYRAPRAAWPEVVAMLSEHGTEFAPMITHRLSLAEALVGFGLAQNKEASKVMLHPSLATGPGAQW
jgi:2-desacetyl-2-hydroxyethyl bacteriochlorophyllide A dehydrogenase